VLRLADTVVHSFVLVYLGVTCTGTHSQSHVFFVAVVVNNTFCSISMIILAHSSFSSASLR
jgi:hypothetical protein